MNIPGRIFISDIAVRLMWLLLGSAELWGPYDKARAGVGEYKKVTTKNVFKKQNRHKKKNRQKTDF